MTTSNPNQETYMDAVQTTSAGIREKAGKYLTFRLAEEEYGLEILKVQEIIQLQAITRIPRTPDFVRGVINLRGKVIPVVDLRRKFSLEQCEDTERTCIIVVQIRAGDEMHIMGVIIEDTPAFGASIDTDFILGMGKIGQGVKILLDIDKVLSAQELRRIQEAAANH
jgi:purine-binding chemotaxis protein CheW